MLLLLIQIPTWKKQQRNVEALYTARVKSVLDLIFFDCPLTIETGETGAGCTKEFRFFNEMNYSSYANPNVFFSSCDVPEVNQDPASSDPSINSESAAVFSSALQSTPGNFAAVDPQGFATRTSLSGDNLASVSILTGNINKTNDQDDSTSASTSRSSSISRKTSATSPTSKHLANIVGRKVDMMVCGSDNCEISICEFKANDDPTTLVVQQGKSLRLNKCLIHNLEALGVTYNENETLRMIAMDWGGYDGTMYEMRDHGGHIVTRSIAPLMLPQDIEEIISDDFRDTIKAFYNYKGFTNSIQQKIPEAKSRKRKQLFQNIVTVSPPHSPIVTPVFNTPKRSNNPSLIRFLFCIFLSFIILKFY